MSSQESRIFFEFDNQDILDIVHQLSSTHSLDAGSSSFVSHQAGPGRTLDNMISPLGRCLENALSSISERIGNGPNVAMNRCLVAVNRALRSQYPWFHPPVRSSKFLQRPPPLAQLLEDIFSPYSMWNTGVCEDRVFIDSCHRLISYLRSDKLGNQILAIYYITALACCKPDILTHLVRLGAPDAIRAAHLHYLWFPKGHRDRSLLLASSKRALVMFSDSTALAVIKELDLVIRKSRKDNCDLSSHGGPLISDLLDLSLNPETQILVARHLSSIASEILLTENSDILQPKLSFRILANWVTLTLTGDPLCSIVFRNLIDKLLLYSNYSATNDTVLSLFVCLLRWKTRGGDFKFVNFVNHSLRRIIRYKYLPNRPTSKHNLPPLRQILSQPSHFDHLSIDADTSSILREIVSPSQEIWSAFCRYWNCPGVASSYLDSIPLRSIPSAKRIQLCRRLLALVLRGECSTTDVLRIASHDVECHETITRLLESSATTLDAEADHIATLREIISSRSTPPSCSLFQTKYLDQWCTGIYRVPTTATQHRPLLIGHSRYEGRLISRSGLSLSESAPELLLGHKSSLHWTPVSDFIAQGTHRNPVRVAGDDHGRDTFIAAIPQPFSPGSSIFVIGGDLVPEKWASHRTEQMYILTRCRFNGQLAEVYWYHRGQHRFTNAFTMEECDPPEWIQSPDIGCPHWPCQDWWKQNQ
ncbi:hypothetical protein JAAARDRAFT_28254 [Jaapia argillacea MUCL 33604]|uniref:Uncharacterized protein n=1 Tax=Jaapia argillacea MUCL 33604 TaxID=933084 RepID=A0A067QC14_9AGAM|nr:hypothetical protein JAAARDRAFT_28254 [Jaapia argillacea MUCL 33604]